jgi:hypothetical protein
MVLFEVNFTTAHGSMVTVAPALMVTSLTRCGLPAADHVCELMMVSL